MDDRDDRLEQLFEQVLALPPEQRAGFLQRSCADEPDLRAQLEALLAQAGDAHDFVERVMAPALAVATESLLEEPSSGRDVAADPLLGQRVAHFEVLDKLGGGGMGVVYRARDTRLDREVALKFLPPHLGLDHEANQRFTQEAKAASALDHPNICTIYEIGEHAGQLFIAMAYYPGETLKQKIAAGPLPIEQAAERERRDVLALQREVALAIARQIEITLTPQDQERLAEGAPVDPEAFDLYVRGTQARYQTTFEGFREAREYFEQAVAQDSGYAHAYAGLAFIHAITGEEARARGFAERALALDPKLAEAHMVLGMIRQFYDWDWAGAESAFRQAIRLNPGYAETYHELSMLLMRMRRFDEALREAQQALYLAPMSARFQVGLGEVYLYAGRYGEAVVAADKAHTLDPTYSTPYAVSAIAYGQQGRYEDALEMWKKCFPLGCVDWHPGAIGHLYAISGRREEALEVLEGLETRWRERKSDLNEDIHLSETGIASAIAQIHAGFGEREQALDWLERGADAGALMLYLAIDPTFRSLHSEPRFQAILRKMGLDT